jgi:hypothetical protein
MLTAFETNTDPETLLRRLTRNPLMTLDPERIRVRAYFHAVNRTGAAWWDPEKNWFQAELEEIEEMANVTHEGLVILHGGGAVSAAPLEFEANHEPIFWWRHPYDGWDGKPREPGTREPRRCSLCRKG